VPHKRCPWCEGDELYKSYHDTEWGVPVYDDKQMFNHLLLESFQAGLSWITILRKRDNFGKAFAEFNPEKIAKFTDKDIHNLMQNEGIIRNSLKIKAAINNAQVFLDIQEKGSGFSDMLWQLVDGKPIQNNWNDIKDIPSQTTTSEHINKHLKKIGFKFIGPTICYAHMQATGMVNDHLTTCYRHKELKLV
jgi:DNA-3-methyladenine glycosylase I